MLVGRWKEQVSELRMRLDTITIDFGKTVAKLKMTEEVRRTPLLKPLILLYCVHVGGGKFEDSQRVFYQRPKSRGRG